MGELLESSIAPPVVDSMQFQSLQDIVLQRASALCACLQKEGLARATVVECLIRSGFIRDSDVLLLSNADEVLCSPLKPEGKTYSSSNFRGGNSAPHAGKDALQADKESNACSSLLLSWSEGECENAGESNFQTLNTAAAASWIGDTCQLCQIDTMQENDSLSLGCGHHFHALCVSRTAQARSARSTCPKCFKDFGSDDIELADTMAKAITAETKRKTAEMLKYFKTSSKESDVVDVGQAPKSRTQHLKEDTKRATEHTGASTSFLNSSSFQINRKSVKGDDVKDSRQEQIVEKPIEVETKAGFVLGQLVEAHGLKVATDLNGQRGRVVEVADVHLGEPRAKVCFDKCPQAQYRTIKPENLKVCSETDFKVPKKRKHAEICSQHLHEVRSEVERVEFYTAGDIACMDPMLKSEYGQSA